MEIVVINTLFLGFVILLKLNKLMGFLATLYCSVWGITIYLLAFLSPLSLPFMTYKSIAVIYGHFFCLVAGAVFAYSFFEKSFSFQKISISSKYLFYGCLIIAGFGILMMLYTTDVLTFYIQNQLAELRGELLGQKIVVNKYYKIMGNMVYPLAIIAPVYFFRKNQNILILIVVVVLGALLSFSNGGKGNLLIVVILLVGGVIYMCTSEKYALPLILKGSAILLIVVLVGFFYLIGATRSEAKDGFSLLDSVELINRYFSSSIPSFSQWMEINNVQWVDFNIDQLSILRELAGIGGVNITRTIDQQVVDIPHPFNVFTAFADSLAAFGYIGSLIYYLLIGAIVGLIDRIDKVPFLFGVFFLFSCYSLFTDIFFYMIGTWICLFFHFMFKIDER